MALAAAVCLAGCGVPTDSEPVAIQADLATEGPVTPAPVNPPTDETTDVEFAIYLADGNRRMQPATRLLPEPVTISGVVMELIEEPTDEESELGLVSAIPAETMLTDRAPFTEEGRAEIDFVSGSLDTLEREELTVALAQLVWTLTGSESIDEIIIKIDGLDQAWPTDEEDTAEGEPLRFEDYDEFDPDFVEPTPTPSPSGAAPVEDATPASDGDG
mgnify:FL=1